MSVLLDTSVLIPALRPEDRDYRARRAVLDRADVLIYLHALNETFATLTGGGEGFRVNAAIAATLIRERLVTQKRIVNLDANDVSTAQAEARARGVRGGAIYDYLHLVAARNARCEALYTLNVSHFLAFRREGDPEIRRP